MKKGNRPINRIRGTLLGFLLLPALLLSACNAETETTKASPAETTARAVQELLPTRQKRDHGEEKTIVLPLTEKIGAMDPYAPAGESESEILSQIYESLFTVSGDGYADVLTASHAITEEGDLALTLREDVHFHSGELLTCADVKESIKRCELSASFLPLAAYVTVETIDEYSLVLHFPYKDYGADADVLMPLLARMPVTKASETDGALSGTGAYLLSEVQADGSVILTRFADYTGEAEAESLIWIPVDDAYEAYRTGLTDAAKVTRSEWEKAESRSGSCADVFLSGNVNLLIINCREGHPGFDSELRDVLSSVIDRSLLNSLICAGKDADNPLFVSVYAEGWADAVRECRQTETEYPSELSLPKTISLLIPSGGIGWERAAKTLGSELAALGVEVLAASTDDLSAYRAGDFDLALISIDLGDRPESYLPLFVPGSPQNLAGVEDEKAAALFESNLSEGNIASFYLAADEMHAYLSLGSPATYLLTDDRLSGAGFTVSGTLDLKTWKWKD